VVTLSLKHFYLFILSLTLAVIYSYIMNINKIKFKIVKILKIKKKRFKNSDTMFTLQQISKQLF